MLEILKEDSESNKSQTAGTPQAVIDLFDSTTIYPFEGDLYEVTTLTDWRAKFEARANAGRHVGLVLSGIPFRITDEAVASCSPRAKTASWWKSRSAWECDIAAPSSVAVSSGVVARALPRTGYASSSRASAFAAASAPR